MSAASAPSARAAVFAGAIICQEEQPRHHCFTAVDRAHSPTPLTLAEVGLHGQACSAVLSWESFLETGQGSTPLALQTNNKHLVPCLKSFSS